MASTPFADAGKAAGVQVWRVEQLKPVPIDDPTQLGQFFTGDAYVVLHTKAGAGGSKSHDAHFWLGAECSQDEAGAAAIFTTELDDALGGRAVQFRQAQGSESPEFLQAFGGRVTYRQGGVKSGFRHVQPTEAPPPVLLRIKGEAHARVSEVPASVDSLTSGDVFLWDGGARLLLWAGAGASVAEKVKAREVLTALTEARAGKPEVTHLAEGEPEAEELYRLLGAAEPGSVAIKPATADAPSADGKAFPASHLYKVADGGGGGVAVSEVQQRPLTRAALQSDSVFAFAAGGKLYLWHGAGASSSERSAGLKLAAQLLAELQLPASTPVQLEKEGMESLSFKEHFDWSAASGGSTPRPQSAAKGKGKRGGGKAKQSPAAAGPAAASPTAASPAAAASAAAASPAAAATPAAAAAPAAASPAAAGTPAKAPAAQDSATPPASAGKASAQETQPERSPAATPAKSAAASPAPAAEAAKPDTPASNGGPSSGTPGKLSLPKHLADGTQGPAFVPKPVAAAEPGLPPPQPAAEVKFQPGKDVFPYEELKGMRAEAGVDMTRKEDYLSADEFRKVFGKSVDEFKAQPKWRQLRAKKEVGLF